MTGRQRVLAALSHRQPDKVPLDLGGTRDSTLVVEAYERLKELFGVAEKTRLCERMMRVVQVDEAILAALDIDTRAVFPAGPTKGRGLAAKLGPNAFRDIWGVERVQPPGSFYYDQTNAPLAGRITVSDVVNYPWPDPDDPGYLRGLKDRAAWIRENTQAASILALPPPFIHLTQYLRGFQDWYMDFVLNTQVLEALFEAVFEVTLRMAENELREVGQEVDVVMFEDDLGAQNGLQISPEQFARHVKPRFGKYLDRIRDLSPAKVLFHSCGSVAAILEDLIELGIHALNPVQTSAAGMEPAALKEKCRGRLALWGAMDNINVLPNGGPAEVRRMVEERIEQLGQGGGYVLSSCHNIQPNVPAENVAVMFRHAREYAPSYAR